MKKEKKFSAEDISVTDIDKALNGNKKKAEKLLSNTEKVKEFINKVIEKLGNIPFIGPYLEDIPLLCSLVVAYVTGEYKDIPLASVITITAALIYFLSPIDLIPDMIPGIGFLDDGLVISIAIGAVHNDLQSFKQWKQEKEYFEGA